MHSITDFIIIAVDPGQSGGFAVTAPRGGDGPPAPIALHNIPQRLADVAQLLAVWRSLDETRRSVLVMEDVGYHVQGNNAQNSATFARHCGRLEGIACTLHLPIIYVQPQLWMNWLLDRKVPKEKVARKTAIYDMVFNRTADLRTGDPLTRRTSDALGICLYAVSNPKVIQV